MRAGDGTMTDSEILALVENEPILAAAGILPTSALVFEPAYRKYCEDNVCGQYGANYSCPPACGTPEQMKRRALRYRRVLVVQSTWEVPGLKDLEKLARGKRLHNDLSYRILDQLERAGFAPDAMLAGHCDRCPEGCRMVQEKPCPRQGKIYSCASAYCLDVAKVCEHLGMTYLSDGDHVSFFSMFLLDQ